MKLLETSRRLEVIDLARSLMPMFELLTGDLPASQILGLGLLLDGNTTPVIHSVNTATNHRNMVNKLTARRLPGSFSQQHCRWDATTWARFSSDLAGEHPVPMAVNIKGVVAENLVAAMSVLHNNGFLARWPNAVAMVTVLKPDEPHISYMQWVASINSAAATADYRAYLHRRKHLAQVVEQSKKQPPVPCPS